MLNLLLDIHYLIPRLIIWALLFGLALTDAIRHRHVKRRGHQLQRGVLLVIGAFIVQDVLLLAYSAQSSSDDSAARHIYLAYIFFTDFADSAFHALLLLIAAGYCITRTDLGPYRQKVLYIPLVYLVTTLVFDYIVNAVKRTGPSIELRDDEDMATREDFSSWEWLVLNVCEIASLLALILAWVYIFDTVMKERELLENPQEGIVGAIPRDVESQVPGALPQQNVNGRSGAAASASTNKNGHAEDVGHEVDVPAEVLLDGETIMSDRYAEVTGNDTDEVKTVEDRMDHRSKRRLMNQFMFGVGGYIIARVLAILLPLFFVNQPGQEDLAIRIVLILENIVLWAFLGALAYIFRLRPDNPYLLLDEFGENAGDSGGEITTELGVMSNEEEQEQQERPGKSSGAGFGRQGGEIDRKFSLGEEDDESAHATGVSQPTQARSRNSAA